MKYPNSTVIAVEPAPDNAEMMRKNFSNFPGLIPVQSGIGPKSGTMFLQDDGGGAWGYRTVEHETRTEVQIKTVEDILRDYKSEKDKPFILKIDIEGAEQGLFEGPLNAISKFPIIIIESHDFYMPGKGTSLPFFKFHSEDNRDFLFGGENIFSIRPPVRSRHGRRSALSSPDPRPGVHVGGSARGMRRGALHGRRRLSLPGLRLAGAQLADLKRAWIVANPIFAPEGRDATGRRHAAGGV